MSDYRITGKMLSFSRLNFDSADPTAALDDLAQRGPALQDTPVLLDGPAELNLSALIPRLRQLGLQILGVSDGDLSPQARALNLPVLPADRPMQRIIVSPPEPVAIPTESPKSTPTPTIHTELLRTGQQLIVEQGDLVVLSDQNSGSEIIAGGNVHVYGTVRGRVLAGASGLNQAHIFCQKLEAELIGIAGTFCLADDIPNGVFGKAAHIFIGQSGELAFEALA